jgi:hypothetical protein
MASNVAANGSVASTAPILDSDAITNIAEAYDTMQVAREVRPLSST